MRGRAVVEFLAINFQVAEAYERLANGGALNTWDVGPGGRKVLIWARRVMAEKKNGTLTPARYFELVAWRRKLRLLPGFLDDEKRCSR